MYPSTYNLARSLAVARSASPRFVRAASTRQRQQAKIVTPPVEPLVYNKSTKEIPSFMKVYNTYDLFCYTSLSFVTAQSWLLKLATKALPYVPTPLIKAFVCPVYTGGENFAEVRQTGRKLLERGVGNMMLSYSVEDAEGNMDGAQLEQSVAEIKGSISEVLVKQNEMAAAAYAAGEVPAAPASGYVALKPTGLMENSADILANCHKPEYAEKYEKYLDVCRSLCQYALDHGKGKVVIVFDAEKDWLQKGVYDAQRRMMKEFNHNGTVVVAGTVQMYLQHSLEFLKGELALAEQEGYQVAMKLVRGAYIHSEPDRWNVIHRTKAESDASYNAGVDLMLNHLMADWKAGNHPPKGPVSRLVVASHNLNSCDRVAERIQREVPELNLADNEDVVFGQLMGMNDDQSTDLSQRGFKVIKYVPWGPAKETKEYLTRRLEENGDAARGGWSHFTSGVRELTNRMLSR